MHNFGFKIVDRAPHKLAPILDYAIAQHRPVEVGLYFEEPEALELLGQRLNGAGLPVNAHSHHERYHAFNLHETEALLREHILLAKRLGSAYSILHTAYLPMNLREQPRRRVIGHLLDNLERAEALCEELDYRLHLENVYHPIHFYCALFEGIHARGLSRIHFCFDIGHAKIWSGDHLIDWLDFLEDLTTEGFGLHCHLHANQGLDDEHLAMSEVHALGIDGPDGYYNPYGYPGAYWVLERRFPDAIKVFEVKPELAIANLETVLHQQAFPALQPA